MFNIEKKLHCAIKNYIGNSENFEKKKFFIWEKCEGVFVKKDKKIEVRALEALSAPLFWLFYNVLWLIMLYEQSSLPWTETDNPDRVATRPYNQLVHIQYHPDLLSVAMIVAFALMLVVV